MTESIVAGFILGIVGSLHCVGMCGPLALSLPVHQFDTQRKWMAILLYNVGRLLTYALLGIGLGSCGHLFAWWGLQQTISILAGVMILILLLSQFSLADRISYVAGFQDWVNRNLVRAFHKAGRPGSFLLIGLLNGLLPCGLVYAAIAASVATMHSAQGLALMLSFGLGTFPMMIGILRFSDWIKGRIRHKLKLAIPVAVTGLALLLIFRGLNLGVPFISPRADTQKSEVSCCHR